MGWCFTTSGAGRGNRPTLTARRGMHHNCHAGQHCQRQQPPLLHWCSLSWNRTAGQCSRPQQPPPPCAASRSLLLQCSAASHSRQQRQGARVWAAPTWQPPQRPLRRRQQLRGMTAEVGASGRRSLVHLKPHPLQWPCRQRCCCRPESLEGQRCWTPPSAGASSGWCVQLQLRLWLLDINVPDSTASNLHKCWSNVAFGQC